MLVTEVSFACFSSNLKDFRHMEYGNNNIQVAMHIYFCHFLLPLNKRSQAGPFVYLFTKPQPKALNQMKVDGSFNFTLIRIISSFSLEANK